MNLRDIAREIASLEYDGCDDDYMESCFYVAQDLYDLNEQDAHEVCNFIEEMM